MITCYSHHHHHIRFNVRFPCYFKGRKFRGQKVSRFLAIFAKVNAAKYFKSKNRASFCREIIIYLQFAKVFSEKKIQWFFAIFDFFGFWWEFSVFYMKNVLFYHIFSTLTSDFHYFHFSRLYIKMNILRIFGQNWWKMTTFWKNQKIFMNIKYMKNPKLESESSDSGEHF